MKRLRLRVWSPLPPSPSGIADYALEQLEALRHHVDPCVVVEDARGVDPAIRDVFAVCDEASLPEADLDLYQIGNSPAHGYIYRRALVRPGVVLLHEWGLHHLVLHETVERGDSSAYLREMRRAYGETGTFVGRQVARALGGELLPARFPLNERLLERSIAAVGLTRFVATRAAAAIPGRPTLHLPHHLSLPWSFSKAEARRALGLSPSDLVVTSPGLATATKRLDVAIRAMGGLVEKLPSLRFIVAGAVDPSLPLSRWLSDSPLGPRSLVTGRLGLRDFVAHLAAADIVLSLRYPSYGEVSGALVRALGLGRPALVTALTPSAEEFPEGVAIPVAPGRGEAAEIAAVLEHLLGNEGQREALGRAAHDHVMRAHDLAATASKLASFLEDVARRRASLIGTFIEGNAPPSGLLGFYSDEVSWAARDLGLPGYPLDARGLFGTIAEASS